MSKWVTEELNILKEYYPIGGVRLVQKKGVERSSGAIKAMASIMAIHIDKDVLGSLRSKWSDVEIDILKKYYPKEGGEVVKRLNNRSFRAVQIKASQLGVRLDDGLKIKVNNLWTSGEVALLYKYYELRGAKYIKAKGVDRSKKAIISKANKLGLGREML